jgi:hypothetical protein
MKNGIVEDFIKKNEDTDFENYQKKECLKL